MGNRFSSKSDFLKQLVWQLSARSPIQPVSSSSQTLQPWMRDLKGLTFLITEPVCGAGVYPPGKSRNLASQSAITFSTKYTVIIFDTSNQTVRELSYDFRLRHLSCIFHSLSPDKQLLVRWRRAKDSADVLWTIEAIDTVTSRVCATLPGQHPCSEADILHAVWFSPNVIYIVDSNQGLFIRWTISAHNESTTSVIRPISSISWHSALSFDTTKDGRWCIMVCTTRDNEGRLSGHVQIHDSVKNVNRVVAGTTCCLAEVGMHGHRKVLFLMCDIIDDKLSITIEQLDRDDPGKPFRQVNINVDTLTPGDAPKNIRVLEELQIVIVSTGGNTVYFFDLYTGTYLYSECLAPGSVWRIGDDDRSLLVNRRDQKSIVRVSVNTQHLSDYIRQVIGDDGLANSVEMRARTFRLGHR